jgi:hypothetical protein
MRRWLAGNFARDEPRMSARQAFAVAAFNFYMVRSICKENSQGGECLVSSHQSYFQIAKTFAIVGAGNDVPPLRRDRYVSG